jgi:dTDP-4-dehydrorhamnose 3,5-epimerase
MGAVKLIQVRRFGDDRGWFVESWNAQRFGALGLPCDWVQDNHSLSRARFVLRGLHFQTPPHAQDKLVRCLRGRIWDVAVDLRAGSPTFARWVAAELSADNARQLFVPVGFAHAFLTLEEDCEVAYKVTGRYAPECDAGLIWNDPRLAIAWPLDGASPVLSDKDARLPALDAFDSPFAYDGEPLEELSEPLIP